MPAWTTFVGLTLVVLVALLVLARASQEYVPDEHEHEHEHDRDASEPPAPGGPDASPVDRSGVPGGADGAEGATVELRRPGRPEPTETVSAAEVPTGVLLANVTVSQATFGVVLLAGAWLARIPPGALGLSAGSGRLVGSVGLGVAVGVVLYVLNAAGAGLASAGGVEYDETLRDLMTPSTARGWVALLGVVLPVVAGFEEFLFRAALIGVPAAGFGLPAWPLAVASSAVFAVGHGAQGRAGIAVTGLLGFGLGAAFVLTGSFVVVVVAHYLVNALEFVVGGHFGIDPFD